MEGVFIGEFMYGFCVLVTANPRNKSKREKEKTKSRERESYREGGDMSKFIPTAL